MKKSTYKNGRIGAFVKVAMSLVQKDSTLLNDFERLSANLLIEAPDLCDRTKCASCGASMKLDEYYFDSVGASLLVLMAKNVKNNMVSRGVGNFTFANQIQFCKNDDDISGLCVPIPRYKRLKAQTLARLGLIAPVTVNGKQTKGIWLITRRGWSALCGQYVPKKVIYFRGAISERSEDICCISDLLHGYLDNEYQPVIFDPIEWSDFLGKYSNSTDSVDNY